MYIYSYENLKRLTQTENGKKSLDECKAYYEENFKDTPIHNLPFTAYKEFFLSGNRKLYETPYFARRARLTALQTLAISDDKYIAELEEIIAAICDEFTWVIPAHMRANKIDLFSSETARILAETLYIFGDRLSAIIQDRMRESVYQKIIRLYEENSFWWDKTNCNWAAVCACGVGITYLYLYPERFERIKTRLWETFKAFLSGFDDEGYCFEGVGYWRYGFQHFCAFFGVYEGLTKNRPDFIDSVKVKKIIQYVDNARMGENIYLPFADGGSPVWEIDTLSACIIKLLYPNDFKLNKISTVLPSSNGFYTRALCGITLFSEPQEYFQEEKSIYYHKAQVFIRKRKKYSFAVQCGNNGVIHNHNDVGAFQIVQNNKRVICDFGAGIYTKEYFGTNEQRYKHFACNSLSHSVPIVDGQLQMWGAEHYGTVLSQSDNLIVMDIAKAYANGPERLIVEYRTEKDFISVKYTCKGFKEKIKFHFVSDIEPIIERQGIRLGDVYLLSNVNVLPEITHREERLCNPLHLEIDKTIPYNVYILDYELSGKDEINAEFIFQL